MTKTDSVTAAYAIAQHLTTRYEGKKHGGYQVYEDEKVAIWYDTYYPNLTVYVKDGDKQVAVLSRSGHGYNAEYHPGQWEDYLRSLYPNAIEAKKAKEVELAAKKEAERRSRFSSINDSHIFA